MQLPTGVQKGLESAINRYLRLDPDSNARMAALDGRCICIELVGLDLQLFIHPGEQGIRLSDHLDAAAEPDTVLRGTPLGMARLGLGQDTEKTLFSGEVTITGDVETGQTFKGILDAMDVDWEEQLSKLTGDVIAHQLANGPISKRRILFRDYSLAGVHGLEQPPKTRKKPPTAEKLTPNPTLSELIEWIRNNFSASEIETIVSEIHPQNPQKG